MVMAVLVGLVVHLRRRRRRMSEQMALVFEDVLPNDIEPLQLAAP